MNTPYFYYVDGDYIEYLKERETQARGFKDLQPSNQQKGYCSIETAVILPF